MKNTPHRHLADSVELEKCTAENYWQVQEQDIVCVPSLSFAPEEVVKIAGAIHYEERQLFNILLLKNPATRLIYITSAPLDNFIVEYYLSLLPSDVPREGLRERLILLSTNDLSPRPLAQKILERPYLISRIKNLLRPQRGFLLCFTSSEFECKLAKELGVPIFGNDLELGYWGSKSGSREIFAEAGIPHGRGVELSHSAEELAQKIAELLSTTPAINKMVVKLNEGFSGQGNAILDLSQVMKPGSKVTKEQVMEGLKKMKFAYETDLWEQFKARIEQMGAIAEEFYEGEDPKCPSVQGCISMTGDVEILSTHEQVLNGQIYQGCMFPASDSYRTLIQRYGRRVGRALAQKGVRGHYGVDFLVSSTSPTDQAEEGKQESDGTICYVYALEINLRQCGTTHPYFTMKFLTDASYDKRTGLCYSSKGAVKYYTASDNLKKDEYKGLLPQDVIEGCTKRNLMFDPESQSGIAFHLLGALSEHGKVGVICVGDTPEAATELFEETQKVLEELGTNSKLIESSENIPKKANRSSARMTAQGQTKV